MKKDREPSYCCVSTETLGLTARIEKWIADREAEGWLVEFQVKRDSFDGPLGVMWQCSSHRDGQYREFSPCISMSGREFRMN